MLSESLGRFLPLTHRRLDYLAVAATGDEQIGALPATLERFPPREALWAGPTAGTYSARALREGLMELDVPIHKAQGGQTLDLGEGAMLRVLAVERKGAVYSLEWGHFRALLPVGMGFESMAAVLADHSLGPQTALLLAESGYAPLNTAVWIEKWRPQVALLSVAADDLQGRPDEGVQELTDGYELLRTDERGWIRLSTDGQDLWVQVERE